MADALGDEFVTEVEVGVVWEQAGKARQVVSATSRLYGLLAYL